MEPDPDSATALIEQRQAVEQVTVPGEIVEEILIHTNRHPYLMQFLCHRLYAEQEDGTGYLRAPTDEDVNPDNLLAVFLVDFQHLTKLERWLLLAIRRSSIVTEAEILTLLSDQSPDRILTFLWGMEKLGHRPGVRPVDDRQRVSPPLVAARATILERMNDALLTDDTFGTLLKVGHAQEVQSFRAEIERLESAYDLAQGRYYAQP